MAAAAVATTSEAAATPAELSADEPSAAVRPSNEVPPNEISSDGVGFVNLTSASGGRTFTVSEDPHSTVEVTPAHSAWQEFWNSRPDFGEHTGWLMGSHCSAQTWKATAGFSREQSSATSTPWQCAWQLLLYITPLRLHTGR